MRYCWYNGPLQQLRLCRVENRDCQCSSSATSTQPLEVAGTCPKHCKVGKPIPEEGKLLLEQSNSRNKFEPITNAGSNHGVLGWHSCLCPAAACHRSRELARRSPKTSSDFLQCLVCESSVCQQPLQVSHLVTSGHNLSHVSCPPLSFKSITFCSTPSQFLRKAPLIYASGVGPGHGSSQATSKCSKPPVDSLDS